VNVLTDRLGSVRANSQGESFAYYPYGEERTSTVDSRDKFATYFRDMVGQDYADQRYYGSGTGRYLSPDPWGVKAARASRPSSWNRYAYVEGEPINSMDRHGLFLCLGCGDDDDDPSNPCDDDPTQIGCDPSVYYYQGGGNNQQSGGGGGSAAPAQKTPCPPVPTLPRANGAAQIQQNITSASNVFYSAVASDSEGGGGAALPVLLGYLTGQFSPKGGWDYKNKEKRGTPGYSQAMEFGNFDFGAVLAGLGFSLTFTQSAAGIAQIVICISGGSCGTGVPFVQYPYGDQAGDQRQIMAGYNYEQAVLAGCVH
jgi:RHS repeat-associated protein